MRSDVWCVLISDVHFNINTLELAKESLKQAIAWAVELGVPLIIAGDLNDTKAIMRAECVNALVEILAPAKKANQIEIILMVGNHDLINEKSSEHSLNFLRPFVTLVDSYQYNEELDLHLIPYHSDTEKLKQLLLEIPEGSTLIMHQGVQGAHMGEYVVDKTSLPAELFASFRVISAHYHRAQDIKCGPPRKGAVGLWSFIGTPYSITYAEAHDGPKGIQKLMNNGLLQQIPLGLRKHVIIETTAKLILEADDAGTDPFELPNPGDLVWLKVSGPASELDQLSKKRLAALLGTESFKLDKIYDEAAKQTIVEIEKLPDDKVLDQLIDDSEETKAQKGYLKKLWREVLS